MAAPLFRLSVKVLGRWRGPQCWTSGCCGGPRGRGPGRPARGASWSGPELVGDRVGSFKRHCSVLPFMIPGVRLPHRCGAAVSIPGTLRPRGSSASSHGLASLRPPGWCPGPLGTRGVKRRPGLNGGEFDAPACHFMMHSGRLPAQARWRLLRVRLITATPGHAPTGPLSRHSGVEGVGRGGGIPWCDLPLDLRELFFELIYGGTVFVEVRRAAPGRGETDDGGENGQRERHQQRPAGRGQGNPAPRAVRA